MPIRRPTPVREKWVGAMTTDWPVEAIPDPTFWWNNTRTIEVSVDGVKWRLAEIAMDKTTVTEVWVEVQRVEVHNADVVAPS